ncbi:MAG: hypothetical protein ACLS4Z_11775 [Christensenellaceae bacterium]
MKKVISVGDLCCERCANRLACKLEMCAASLKQRQITKRTAFSSRCFRVPDDELKDAAVRGFEADCAA